MTFEEFCKKFDYAPRVRADHGIDWYPRGGGVIYADAEFRSKYQGALDGIGCCRECGWPEHHVPGLCFDCNFWTEKLSWTDGIRIEGSHYRACEVDSNTPSAFRGYGGRLFKIKMKDGREIVTSNLWHQGRIPEWFRERLPDNAEFVNV